MQMFDQYLQGFSDGYKKAMENVRGPLFKVTTDGKELAEIVYQDVTELQEGIKE